MSTLANNVILFPFFHFTLLNFQLFSSCCAAACGAGASECHTVTAATSETGEETEGQGSACYASIRGLQFCTYLEFQWDSKRGIASGKTRSFKFLQNV
jgi:hypothetical protein